MPRIDQIAEQSPGTVTVLRSLVGVDADGKGLRLQHRAPRPMMTFIDDDGGLPTIETFFPLLASKGVPGCAAIAWNNLSATAEARNLVGGTPMMTVAEVLQLQAAGWEIASHTMDHDNLPLDDAAAVEYQLSASLDNLTAAGCVVHNLVYPFSANDATVRSVARKYYRAAFGNTAEYQVPPLATFQVRRKVIGGLTLAQMKASIDAAVAANGWLVWSCHTYQPEYTTEFFADVGLAIDYALSLGVEIVTPNAGLDAFGNLFDQGDPEGGAGHFRIDATGKPDSLIVLPSVIDSAQPITAYPIGESIATINASAGNYPTNVGTVITYRSGLSLGSDYQIVTTRNSGQVWRRCWDEVAVAWREFYDTKQGYPTITATLDFGSFAANQVKTLYVDYPGVINGDIAIGQPQNGYSGQWTWALCCTSDGRIEVRLHNASASAVVSTPRAWWLSAIKRY